MKDPTSHHAYVYGSNGQNRSFHKIWKYDGQAVAGNWMLLDAILYWLNTEYKRGARVLQSFVLKLPFSPTGNGYLFQLQRGFGCITVQQISKKKESKDKKMQKMY